MRLFLSVSPDERVRESVASWARRAGRCLPGARWQPAENLHLTLRFLGDVDEAGLEPLPAAIGAAVGGHHPLRLRLGGPETLPRGSRARVACIGVVPVESLTALRADVATQAERALGLAPDPRRFTPHLTLARSRRPWRAAACAAWRGLSFPHRGAAFEVTYVELMESLSSPSGARYRTVERFPLAC